jgi:hypothetical protein
MRDLNLDVKRSLGCLYIPTDYGPRDYMDAVRTSIYSVAYAYGDALGDCYKADLNRQCRNIVRNVQLQTGVKYVGNPPVERVMNRHYFVELVVASNGPATKELLDILRIQATNMCGCDLSRKLVDSDHLAVIPID